MNTKYATFAAMLTAAVLVLAVSPSLAALHQASAQTTAATTSNTTGGMNSTSANTTSTASNATGTTTTASAATENTFHVRGTVNGFAIPANATSVPTGVADSVIAGQWQIDVSNGQVQNFTVYYAQYSSLTGMVVANHTLTTMTSTTSASNTTGTASTGTANSTSTATGASLTANRSATVNSSAGSLTASRSTTVTPSTSTAANSTTSTAQSSTPSVVLTGNTTSFSTHVNVSTNGAQQFTDVPVTVHLLNGKVLTISVSSSVTGSTFPTAPLSGIATVLTGPNGLSLIK
ncbi:MAG: hypothetical protein ABI361_11525 [Nitrososphaera sp.]